MGEVYVSVDVETDGPCPGLNSMLSVGAAAFSRDGNNLGTFERNIKPAEGAEQNPSTMEWWATQPEAWKSLQIDVASPEVAMADFAEWVDRLPGKAVFVGYPAGFDFTFVYYYFHRYVGRSPFSFSALDIKSFAMAKLGTEFRQTVKKRMPKKWFPKTRHTHVALDDAREQGLLFINMLSSKDPETP